MKTSLIEILTKLGFKHPRDIYTIVPLDVFEDLDDSLVAKAIEEYGIRLGDARPPFDAEIRMEIVNKILELKHGMIIEVVPLFDREVSDPEGYVLEELKAPGA